METHNYRVIVEESGINDEPVIFYVKTHDNLRKIICKLEKKDNFTPDLARAFATGLKIFAQCVRENAQKELFIEITPYLNSIMKIVKG